MSSYAVIPNTFIRGQLVSSAKTNANFTALLNAITDGTKKTNVADLYIGGVLFCDVTRAVSALSITATSGTITTFGSTTGTITTLNSTTGNITTLNSTTANISGNASVTGNATITGNVVHGTDLISIDDIKSEKFKILSGYSKTSGYPRFLALTTGTNCKVDTNTGSNPLYLVINGSTVTVSADLTVSSIAIAPGSNNTVLVNDTAYADQVFTKTEGEFGSTWITIDTEGSEVVSLSGTVQCFKHGAGPEYFIGYVDTTAHKINAFKRGIGGSLREIMANNDAITLMKATYIFVGSDGTTTYQTTKYPTFSATAPSGATGEWWFDLTKNVWKKYSGSWVQTNAVFLGYAISDSTGVVAVEMVDYDKAWSDKADYTLEYVDAGTIRVNIRELSVAGTTIIREGFGENVTFSNLDTGAEASSTLYYVYVKPTGAIELSLQCPRPKGKLKGLYKPHDYHRCIGTIYNDGSSNLNPFIQNKNEFEFGLVGQLTHTVTPTRYALVSIPPFAVKNHLRFYGDNRVHAIQYLNGLVINREVAGTGAGVGIPLYSSVSVVNENSTNKLSINATTGNVDIMGYKGDF